MKAFIIKHKRLLAFAVAILFILVVYYFTLGPGSKPKDSLEGSTDSGSDGLAGTSGSPSSSTASSFPLKWGVKNTNTVTLQNRLNQSIACYNGTKLTTDGILGSNTLAAIKRSFPTIGANVEATRQVSMTEYNLMINSKPSCL